MWQFYYFYPLLQPMKKIAVLVTLLYGGMLNPQSVRVETKRPAFEVGEWFLFRIHYGIFNASYASLKLQNHQLNGKTVYHAVGEGKTTGLARLFFKVDDRYESYFDKESGTPYKFIRQIDEGGHTKDLEINFDHASKRATVKDHKHNSAKTIKIYEGIQDMLSAFYYLRDNYRTDELFPGQEIILDMIFDDDELFRFKLKFLGRETIRSKFGKVPCLKFRPYVQSGRVFKESESLTLWISADDNKIPIRIKADLRVGSLKADLDAYKGLKHPFNLIME